MIGNKFFASGMSTFSSSYLLGPLQKGLNFITDHMVSMNGNISDGFHKADRVFTADRNLVCGLIIFISSSLII